MGIINLVLINSTTMHNVKKQNLPFKICIVCKKPFSWRKKWEKNWDEVKYCSDRCRSQRQKISMNDEN